MNSTFSGWREGIPHYLPWFAIAIIATVALRHSGFLWVSLFFWAIAVGVLLFFRDFPRSVVAQPNEVVSPADGTVVGVEILDNSPYFEGKSVRLSIFMSVFNVHVNRIPFDGTVHAIRYEPGQYKNAMRPESSQLNESNAVWLKTDSGPITVRQISGAVARRIVCRAVVGSPVKKGEKFGMIKFGSRVELYLPEYAIPTVTVGDKPRAGITVVARFP